MSRPRALVDVALLHGRRRVEAADLMPPSTCRLLELGLRSGTADSVMEDVSRRMQEEVTQDLEQMVARVAAASVMAAFLSPVN